MTKQIIIAVVGLIGSGKTEATQKFIEAGFERVGFNDRVYEELDQRGLACIEKNERAVREELRAQEGMGVMAKRSLSKVESALRDGKNVVVESLYSWDEYKIMKERFGEQFRTLAIYAQPEIRYRRLAARPIRPLSLENAISRDYAQIENLDQAGPIVMADWTIENIGTREELLAALDKIINGL
ncbi:MAG: AAA family ATPase [Candidatus Sungbacteria bacterium]|nr:AAA family ATPase [Candidatus Sungbacteria bacterium]